MTPTSSPPTPNHPLKNAQWDSVNTTPPPKKHTRIAFHTDLSGTGGARSLRGSPREGQHHDARGSSLLSTEDHWRSLFNLVGMYGGLLRDAAHHRSSAGCDSTTRSYHNTTTICDDDALYPSGLVQDIVKEALDRSQDMRDQVILSIF